MAPHSCICISAWEQAAGARAEMRAVLLDVLKRAWDIHVRYVMKSRCEQAKAAGKRESMFGE